MNQSTNGPINLDEQLDKILADYESTVNIKLPELEEDYSPYLRMDRDYLEALSREQKLSIALQLSQYAAYIQRMQNREKARLSFANGIIANIAAKHWFEYDKFLKYDVRVELIAKENPTMSKAIKLKNNADLRIVLLDDIARSVRHISDILTRYSYVE